MQAFLDQVVKGLVETMAVVYVMLNLKELIVQVRIDYSTKSSNRLMKNMLFLS